MSLLSSCAGLKTGVADTAADRYGSFCYYIPRETDSETRILVLLHGTPKDLSPEDNALFYTNSWLDFADSSNCILLAPAFTQADFSSRYGNRALSGYRGLFGRETGADEWVLRLVDILRRKTGISAKRICIYGHSAGGQFTARFIMEHPETVESAVITSAATYPRPDKSIQWPFGMGELHSDISWDDGTVTRVDVIPDEDRWLTASLIPLTVIVGLEDGTELPRELIPGQRGNNRYTIASNWVEDMIAFAEARGLESLFRIELIPGVGHSMTGLLPYSRQAMLVTQPKRSSQ